MLLAVKLEVSMSKSVKKKAFSDLSELILIIVSLEI